MGRHIVRKHITPQIFLPIFPKSSVGRQVRFNFQKSNYHHPPFDLLDSSKSFNWPFSFVQDATEPKCPSWLERLRRLAEISKLTAEIAHNRIIQFPINPFTASANENLTQEPQFKFEDLRIVGYTAFICQKCLIFHPLTLYWHNSSMKVIPTNHECDTNTVVEVQRQKRNKMDIIETVSMRCPN